MSDVQETCYSGRLVQPFVQVLHEHPAAAGEQLRLPVDVDLDSRVPIGTAHELLRAAVNLTGDQDLGLKAALTTEFGYFGTMEYAAGTAATWRDSVNAIVRFAPLINEAAEFRLEVVGPMATLFLASKTPLSRTAGNFCTAALWRAVVRWIPELPVHGEVWFAHPSPAELSRYRSVFANAQLVFDASDYAIAFEAALLNRENARADSSLHAIMMDHGERLLAELPKVESLSERVRRSIIDTMSDGTVSAERVAAMLNMSRRTLSRQLGAEGASFRSLLEDVRKRFAKHYLESTNMAASDIAFSLGFSQSAAFVRAFSRWVGCAPGEYRRRLRS